MVAMTLSKILIVSINIIFMLFGLAILVVGIIFKVGWDNVREAFDDEAAKVDFDLQKAGDTAGVSAITFGSIILILAFLGCAGACCKNRCLLGTYATILLVIVVAQIAVVALIAVKGGEAEDKLVEAFRDTLKNYKEDSSDDFSKSWSSIFDSAECCGVHNNTDFGGSFKADTTLRNQAGIVGYQIPITCCHNVDYEDDLTKKIFVDNTACLETPDETNAYITGCYDKVEDWINDNKKVVIGVGIGVLLFELVLSAMAFFMCCRHDDD